MNFLEIIRRQLKRQEAVKQAQKATQLQRSVLQGSVLRQVVMPHCPCGCG